MLCIPNGSPLPCRHPTIGGNNRTLTYQYDPNGNRTRLTFQDGNYVSTEFDGLGRPVWIRENGTERLGLLYYHPHGGRKIFHRSGTSTTYYYDAALRLSQLYIGYQPSAANRVDNWLSYNPANQIVTDTRNNDAYAWNAHYNVERDYATNGLNQYTAAGQTGFGYDSNGNLIQSGPDKTYVYDIENRMVGAAGGITLTYDPMGRLFQVSGGTAGTTQFLYDGDKLVAEYDGSNTIKRRYAHGPGVDEPIAWYDGAGFGSNRRRLQEDRHGSIVSVTDSAGNLITINTYDEYGIPAATNLGRFQYTGQAWLDELGMYYYKARIYSPTLGRFMQTDPIGYEDQVNLYAYVRTDPVNNVDPLGTCETKDNPDGTTTQVGICGTSDEARALVDPQIRDVNSALGETEKTLIQQGATMPVDVVHGDPNINGSAHLITEWKNQKGEVVGHTDRVVIDVRDKIVVDGEGPTGRPKTEVISPQNELEHEAGGHGDDFINQRPYNEERAISVENAYRRKNGDTFRRVGHGGTRQPRRN